VPRSLAYVSPTRRHDRPLFFKYTTAKVAKIIFATRRLRWSSPLLFNDPFDLTQELRLGFSEEELNAALLDRWTSILETGDVSEVKHPIVAFLLGVASRAPAETRLAMAEELRATFKSKSPTKGQVQAMSMLKAFWKEMVPTFRIVCFSEVNDLTPMWLHYAEGYKGVVLEFKSVDEVDSPLLIARPVIYQDGPPKIATAQAWVDCMLGKPGADYWELFSQLQYIKTSAWAYEREWRVVAFARPGDTGFYADYPFFESELTGIYFGPQCAPEDRKDLLALRQHGLEHVRPFEAVPSIAAARFDFRPV
jgi:hypothetical protein